MSHVVGKLGVNNSKVKLGNLVNIFNTGYANAKVYSQSIYPYFDW